MKLYSYDTEFFFKFYGNVWCNIETLRSIILNHSADLLDFSMEYVNDGSIVK